MMQPEISQGYMSYSKGYGPVWVALHSGPAIRRTSRDDNSDSITSMCWDKTGGSLIFSNMPRDMIYGIDFNRELPSPEISSDAYPKFMDGKYSEEKKKYRNKYAFVSDTKKCYNEKARIYKSMWSKIRNSGDFIIFIHRQYARLKNYPSAIDLITFNDCGIKREILKKIVDDINQEKNGFFRKIEKNFKNVTYTEQIKKLNLFGIGNRYIMNDVKILKQHCDKGTIEKLKKDFCEQNFLNACSQALKSMPMPEVTLERVFSAESAIGPKKEIIKNHNKIAVEVEVNYFMSDWYPRETAEIILEITDKIRKVDEYKKMGMSQTQILKFIL